jgi:hypothetical protein
MDRKHLSPEEREEYDALLREAGYDEAGNRRPSGEIKDHMHELLVDAVKAGRTWAGYVIDDDARDGHLKRFKRWDRVRTLMDVNNQSVIVKRSAVMGVKRRDAETGAIYDQQVLYAEMAWNEVIYVMESAQVRISSDRITVGICTKLLALKLRCPESAGPADACARLGLDMHDYLISEEAA